MPGHYESLLTFMKIPRFNNLISTADRTGKTKNTGSCKVLNVFHDAVFFFTAAEIIVLQCDHPLSKSLQMRSQKPNVTIKQRDNCRGAVLRCSHLFCFFSFIWKSADIIWLFTKKENKTQLVFFALTRAQQDF